MGREPHEIEDVQSQGQLSQQGIGDGVSEGGVDPAEAVHRLEEQADAIRGNLNVLVDEVERRGRRLAKPVVIGAGAVALAALVIGGVAAWRSLRRPPPSRLRGLRQALLRIADHPERVAEASPSVSKRVLASVGATVASLAIHQLARMATAKLARTDAAPSDGSAAG